MTGQELREALDRLDITQKRLSEMLTARSAGTAVSPATVNNWCNGKYPVPGALALAIELLERIKALGHDYLRREK